MTLAVILLVQLNGKKGPDVYYVQDKFIKQFSSLGYCLDLTDFVANSKYDTKLDESDLFSNILSRYRYDKVTTTSNIDDPLWAVPKDLAPTAIFYNKTHFKTAGITCISIPEEDISAFIKATDSALVNMSQEPVYYVDYIYEGSSIKTEHILDIGAHED